MGFSVFTTAFARQLLVINSILLNYLSIGMFLGLPSTILPVLIGNNTEIPLTNDQASWIASVRGISYVPILIVIPVIANRLGRKTAQFLISLPLPIAWCGVIFGQSFLTLLFSFILLGISLGGIIPISPLCVGEFSSPKFRGLFLTLTFSMIFLGILLEHGLGILLYWRTVAIISMMPALLSILMTFFWPESPLWLASKKRFEECRESFQWLRGGHCDNDELNEIILKYENINVVDSKITLTDLYNTVVRAFHDTAFTKPLLIMIAMFTLMEVSARALLPSYAFRVLKDLLEDESVVPKCMVTLDALCLISLFTTSQAVSVIRRRTILLASGCLSILFLLLTTLVSFLSLGAVLPMITFSLYVFFTSSGFLGILNVLLGEVIPMQYKVICTLVIGLYAACIATTFQKLAPYVLDSVGVYGTFLFISVTSSLCLCYLAKALPETKGRTLIEIENYYKYGEYLDQNTAVVKLNA